jgi:Tol biopolymer transport system component
MNANGSARRNVTATPNVSESDPDSSPDGDELAFMDLQDSGRLFVRRVDGTNPREFDVGDFPCMGSTGRPTDRTSSLPTGAG